MLRRIREPFGKAGLIVAIVALVAALGGGAFAASGLTGKQKKEVRKIAMQLAGQDGAQGAAGQPGPAGQKGDTGAAGTKGADGANGTNGIDGTNGKAGKNGDSVTVIPLSSGDANCPSGGAKFTNLTGSAFACNGEGGGGGYPEQLPPGRTMTGFWEVQGTLGITQDFGAGPWAVSTISYPLPLATPPVEKLLLADSPTEEEEDKCPGSATSPEAAPGVLCLYPLGAGLTLKSVITTTFGAVLLFAETDKSFGSWAVTAAP